MSSLNTLLTNLGWDDLRQWAGGKILNRGKSYVKNVYDLAGTENGGLVAWVSGSEDYATRVDIDEHGELDWFCTCPYDWGPCKHAVAVILVGLEFVKAGKQIPVADREGDLFQFFSDQENFLDEDVCDEEDHIGRGEGEQTLLEILQKKKKEELLELLLEFSRRHPEVKRKILEDDQLQHGKIEQIASSLLAEIEDVTSEPAWYNGWKDEGHLPDYSHIQEQLAILVQKGHADVVLELGRELWDQGSEQVGQSHDDGETACEIQECMEIIFKAVPTSSLTRPDQLLWMIDIDIEDDYSLADSCEQYIQSKVYKEKHWEEVADILQDRLESMPKPRTDSFSERYQREGVMNWLIRAFERGGRQEEVLPLLEKEAHATQCYLRIVEIFLANSNTEKARQWCVNGYRKTINDAPGIADRLQKKLRELAQEEENYDLAAAYHAYEFFDYPSRSNYIELKKTAEKIEQWPVIRSAVLGFLENGQRPDQPVKGKKLKKWPLPAPEVVEKKDKRFHSHYPDLNTLIDIAIFEKRYDDAIKLYRSWEKTNQWGPGRGKEVAEAVAGSHPDVSLDIWKKIATNKINLVKPAAYDEAAVYLRKIQKVYSKTKRNSEWQDLLRSLRTEHKRKRRLLEVLDSLEGKRIID